MECLDQKNMSPAPPAPPVFERSTGCRPPRAGSERASLLGAHSPVSEVRFQTNNRPLVSLLLYT